MSSSIFMIKNLNNKLPPAKEKIPDNSILYQATSTTVFISEIGLPFINNLVGMHRLITDHITLIGQPVIYLIAILCSNVEAILHYALLFDVYKKAIGLDNNKIQTLENEFVLLNQTLIKLLAEEKPTQEELNELETSFKRIMKQKDGLIQKTKFRKFVIFCLLVLLLGIFAALRASGGYFILIHFFSTVGLTAFSLTPVGMIIMWSLIALFAFEGYQTRKGATSELLNPLQEKEFDNLEETYRLFKEKCSEEQDIDGKKTPGIEIKIEEFHAACQCLSIYDLKLIALFTSEIGFPLLNDFIGMTLLLTDHAAFLEQSTIYFISVIVSIIDLTVFYAQIFPVLKTSVGLSSVSTQEITEAREQLRLLNEIADKLLQLEADKNFQSNLVQFIRYYDEIITFKNIALEETIGKKFIQGVLLGVFVALRISGGYFILTNFFLALGATTFALSPMGLGITWGLIALYAYRGFGTRKTAITDLLCPLAMGEFGALEKKHAELKIKACTPRSLFHTKELNVSVNVPACVPMPGFP